MNPLGALLLVACIAVVLFAPRHIALLGMMAAVLYLPFAQQVYIGGFNLFAMRFVELAGFSRVLLRKELSFQQLNKFDKTFLLLFAYTVIVFVLRSEEDKAYKIGTLVDAYLCYFTFRGLLRTAYDFKRFLRGFLVVLAPFVIFVMIETLTGKNPFSVLGEIDPGGYTRNGRQRAFGSFEHPSLVGTLGASFIPLYIAYAYKKVNRRAAYIGLGFCLAIIWASNSGAPISCLIFAVLGWLFWKVRTKMSMVRRSIVAFLVVLALVMKSPIWYLPAHLSDFTGGDGYHRSYLVDIFIQNIGKWGSFGMRLEDTADWFPTRLPWGVADITNQYISFGVTAGVISMALFIILFVKGFGNLGKAMAALRGTVGTPTETEFLLWGLGVMLLVHAVNFFGITYYDQTFVIWYMHLAVISTLSERYFNHPIEDEGRDQAYSGGRTSRIETGGTHDANIDIPNAAPLENPEFCGNNLAFRSVLASVIALGIAQPALSAQIYVAQSNLGNGTGSNPENACGASYLNNADNWNSPDKVPGKIGPGDTLHICGCISTPLVVQAAGTPGNPITLLFEPGASMSAPNWNQHGRNRDAAIFTAKSYITIDGGANGIIRATSNGTELATQLYNIGVYVDNASNVSVKNLAIQNLYVRTRGADPSGSHVGGVGIYFLEACDNALVSKCAINDVYYSVILAFGNCSNFEVRNCNLSNMGVGIVIGSANRGCVLTRAVVHDNRMSIGSNWEGYPAIHRECVHAFAVHHGPDSAINELRIYDNFFTGDLGNNATAYCFIEGYVDGPWVFNNLFVQPNSNSGGNGFLAFKGTESAMAMNNTFVGFNGGREIAINAEPVTLGARLGHNLTIANNVFCHCATAIYDATPQVTSSDYNVFDTSPQFYHQSRRTITDLSGWKAVTGQDSHSSTRDSNLDPVTYVPRAGSAAIAAGKDESAYFSTDKNGIGRAQGSSWDVGALVHGLQ
jgi:hypothetical protein